MKAFNKIFVFTAVFMFVSVASFAAGAGQNPDNSPTDCTQNVTSNVPPAQAAQGQIPAPAGAQPATAAH